MGGADPWLRRRRLAIRGVVLPGTPAAFRAAAAAALGAALLLALFGLLAAIGIAVDGDDLGVVNEAVDERDEAGGVGVLDVLGKRLGRYGLTLHETKTRYVDFRRRRPYGRHWMASATTFDFLGFTHVWGRSMGWPEDPFTGDEEVIAIGQSVDAHGRLRTMERPSGRQSRM